MRPSIPHPEKAAMLLFFFFTAILTSCNVGHSDGAFNPVNAESLPEGAKITSYSSVSFVKEQKGYKTITTLVNEDKKSVEANQPFHLESGVISNYEEGLVLKLKEERDGIICDAELIEEKGVLTLHVKKDALIKAFYENETEWLEDFFHTLLEPNVEKSTSLDITSFSQLDELLESVNVVDDTVFSSEIEMILKGLESISMSSSRVRILEALLDKELKQVGQVAVAESIFNQISMSSDRTSLILKLIDGQELSRECKEYIVDNIDMISMSSDREEVLMALVKK